ncbi:conserved hypothetical protein [Ricinus communis]|uniref:Uncharacterized protein n=1 Tax=Ricinus communis TaxID=3988 RepID=B9TNS7_RICCO|nr:conserved hypothetical protein [Ricinus communis]
MQCSPCFQRLPPLDKIGVGRRQLPDPVGTSGIGLERHEIDVLPGAREVEQPRHRTGEISIGAMRGHVADRSSVDVDGPPVLQSRQILLGTTHRGSPVRI